MKIHQMMLTLTLLFTLSFSTSMAAGPGGDEDRRASALELQTYISEAVDFPQGYRGESHADVRVDFRVTHDLRLHVIDVTGENPELNDHVKEVLEGKNLNRFSLLRGRRAQVKVAFRKY
ncbi:MAG: hypothetical protein AAF570_18840 [Bacteroidota bacterium]